MSMFGFIFNSSFVNPCLSLGEIRTESHFPYLSSILSNDGAGDEIGFRVRLIDLILEIRTTELKINPHLIISSLLSLIRYVVL